MKSIKKSKSKSHQSCCNIMTFFRRARTVIRIIPQKELYVGPSYFPELRDKSKWRCFLDQAKKIFQYGSPEYFYFMYGLDHKHGEEYTSYLCQQPFRSRRNFLNYESHANNNSCCLLRNKFLFGIICNCYSMPTVENLFYLYNDELYKIIDGQMKHVAFESLKEMNVSMFCKAVDGECGQNTFLLDVKDHRLFFNMKEMPFNDLQDMLRGSDFLFQKKIMQHEDMAKLNSTSINTIRMVTVRSLSDGCIHVIPSLLRIGANGSLVDNTSKGGYAVGINLETGRLDQYGYQKPKFGLKSEVLSHSGIRFSDFRIPYFQEAKQLAIEFHSKFKDIHSIGWDIAITPQGPLFIEGNDNWEISGPQTVSHGLSHEFGQYFFSK